MENNPLSLTCPTCAGLGLIVPSEAPAPFESPVNNSDISGSNYVSTVIREKISDRKKADAICAFLEAKGVLTRDDLIFYANGWNSKDSDILKLDAQLFSDRDLEFIKVRFHYILKEHIPIEHKHSSSAKLAPSTAAPSLLQVPSSSGRRTASADERGAIAQALSKWCEKKRAESQFEPILEWIFNNYLQNGSLKSTVLVQMDGTAAEVACPICTSSHRISSLKATHPLTRHIAEAHLGWPRGKYLGDADETSSSTSGTPKRKQSRVQSRPASTIAKQPRLEFGPPATAVTIPATVTEFPPALPVADSNSPASSVRTLTPIPMSSGSHEYICISRVLPCHLHPRLHRPRCQL